MSQFVQPVVLAAEEGDYMAIVALITEGLVERWGWHDTTLNPDLATFSECYRHATVVVAKQTDRVVGCGVLVAENDQEARIVRMSVSEHVRRCGIGRSFLAALLEKAKSTGCRRVVLETSADWTSAINFYVANGFTPTRVENGDQHFVRNLA